MPASSNSLALTTRPLADGLNDVAVLAERNIMCLPAPMLTIKPLTPDLSELENVEAIVLTSRHAAKLLKGKIAANIPCYVVGTSTARVAKESGFQNIIVGGGDGKTLVDRISQDELRAVLWVAAVDTGFNIQGALRQKGITTFTTQIYKAEKVHTLPPDVIAALDEGKVRAVLIHSGRAAIQLSHLLDKNGYNRQKQQIAIIAISSRAAEVCGQGWQNIIIAKQPQRAFLFDAVATYFENLL